MNSYSIPENPGLFTEILDDFHTEICSPSDTVNRIDQLIKNYPEILSNAETGQKLCEITSLLFSQQSKMEEPDQETIKRLFFHCHHLTPKRVKGLLSKDSSAKDALAHDKEASAFIRGKQNYPIPASILKDEALPAKTYFRSLEIKLNDSCTRKICAGLLGHYSEMVNTMVKTEGLAPPSSLTLDMLDSHQFDMLIAYLETGQPSLINQDNAVELLYAADFLQIPKLVEVCKQFLLKQNDPISILYLINFLKFHKSEVLVMVLEQKISDYLLKEFSKNEISEDFLSNIERFKNEVSEPLSINLARSQISDDQLKLLESIPIASLDLSNCENLSKGCLEPLKKFSHLRTLRIAMSPWITDEVFALIPDQVRSLHVEGCKDFTGAGLENLSSTQVRQLYLFGCSQLTDDDLARLPLQLEYVDLRHQQKLKEKGFRRLAEMGNLHTLVLADIPISKELLAQLPINLRNLDISLCFSEEGFLPQLSHLVHLEKLYSSNNPVKDRDIEDIPRSINTLALVSCIDITDNAVRKLGERAELKQLFLRRCPKITEDAIDELPERIEVDWDAPSAISLAFRK